MGVVVACTYFIYVHARPVSHVHIYCRTCGGIKYAVLLIKIRISAANWYNISGDDMKTEEFIQVLHENKNPENIEPMENYMRNQFPFLGIKSVQRRQLAQPFFAHLRTEARGCLKESQANQSVIDWETVYTLWEQPEREFQQVAVDYLRSLEKHVVKADLPHLEKVITTKSWWDTVDALAKVVGAAVLKDESLIETMRSWSLAENMWIRRVSILHQLTFKEQTNVELLREIVLNNIHDEDFFIRKAIGWILREYAKTDEQWVVHFTQEFKEELSSLSYREALKNVHLN